MMYVYPDGVSPSWTIKLAALNIWKYYYLSRADVKKETINKDDGDYINHYQYNVDDTNQSDPEILKLINTKYSLKPSKEFNILLDNGVKYMQEFNVKSEVFSEKELNKYFQAKYNKAD
jgi:hypothetical protein